MATSAILLTDRTKLATGAFRVVSSISQNITNNTITKIQFDSLFYDVDNWYDDVTNFRYTPQQAGKYFIAGLVRMGQVIDIAINLKIRKNGSTYSETRAFSDVDVFAICNLSDTVDMNGTTDFIELFMTHANTGLLSRTIVGTACVFTGFLIGE